MRLNPSASTYGFILFTQSIIGSSVNARAPRDSFEEMLSHYAFLTTDEEYKGFSGYRLAGSGEPSTIPEEQQDARWLVVEEFTADTVEQHDEDLMRIQMKHWWYKNGWEQNAVAFYKVEEASNAANAPSSKEGSH